MGGAATSGADAPRPKAAPVPAPVRRTPSDDRDPAEVLAKHDFDAADAMGWLFRLAEGYVWRKTQSKDDFVGCVRALSRMPRTSSDDGALDAELAAVAFLCKFWRFPVPPGSASSDGEDARYRIVTALRDLERGGVVSRGAMAAHCDADLLRKLGITKQILAGLADTEAAFKQREKKVRTKLFYSQTKYNLLSEACEGYAKLVTTLENFGRFATPAPPPGDDVTMEDATAALDGSPAGVLADYVQSLIGRFSLDPNRVLDVVLEMLEQYPRSDALWALVPLLYASHPEGGGEGGGGRTGWSGRKGRARARLQVPGVPREGGEGVGAADEGGRRGGPQAGVPRGRAQGAPLRPRRQPHGAWPRARGGAPPAPRPR